MRHNVPSGGSINFFWTEWRQGADTHLPLFFRYGIVTVQPWEIKADQSVLNDQKEEKTCHQKRERLKIPGKG